MCRKEGRARRLPYKGKVRGIRVGLGTPVVAGGVRASDIVCVAPMQMHRGARGGVLTPFFGMSQSVGLAADEELAGAGSKKRKEHIGPFG